ncbi:MAG: hypothetical protein H6810_03080 [Phycisphaeraceae bacterium]|nr:MAG: hypothetical protein H6810_03080 [Phycisphaeraceae bacterium]
MIESDAGVPRPPFDFDAEDAALLDEVQRAAFAFFWDGATPGTGLIRDRSGHDTVSVAGIGFGLSALPIGVERGWITRDEGGARARLILTTLLDEPTNRKAGLYYHFLNPDGTPRRIGTELVVSTIDSAILFSGAIVACEYFGGDVGALADRMLAEADWSFFVNDDAHDEYARGFISLGWRPTSDADPTGPGSLLPYSWIDSGDEHRLATVMGVIAPTESHRVDPALYYRLRREVGWHDPDGELVWFPYSGALFTALFSHCWIDYAHFGADDPAARGMAHRARVDWWENTRRTIHLHRDKAIANPLGLPTLGPDAWGLSACDGPDGYLVPGLFPEPVKMLDAQAGRDYPVFKAKDDWGDGVVPPYAAASAIAFEPELALRAMRHYRSLESPDGSPLVWRGLDAGGFGFVDSFRTGETPWHGDETVAIDQGPMLLLIENARTGLIWRLFGAHPAVDAGFRALGFR